MGSDGKPNSSDLTIVTVVLQYSVFATLYYVRIYMGPFVTNNPTLVYGGVLVDSLKISVLIKMKCIF